MKTWYIVLCTLAGLVFGIFSGWILAMLFMMAGYGAYSFLIGILIWGLITFWGFLIGMFLFLK